MVINPTLLEKLLKLQDKIAKAEYASTWFVFFTFSTKSKIGISLPDYPKHLNKKGF